MRSSQADRFDLVEGSVDPKQAQRLSAFKTVEAFAGITRRRLWLKESQKPHTDGNEIGVPLNDPAAYKLLGHQLAHILFQSNPHARKLFVEEYVKRVSDLVEKNGRPLEPNQKGAFEQLLHEILNSVECHRVESLWGLLYSGSYRFGRVMAREDVQEQLELAHESFAVFLSVLEAGCDPPSGRYDRFRPYVVEAFKKSELRGPNATFVVGKWLITHLVSEILREARDQPPVPEMNAQLPDLEDVSSSNIPAPQKDQPEKDPNSGNPENGETPDPSELPPPSSDNPEGESVGNSGMTPPPEAEGKSPGGSDGPGKDSDLGPDSPSGGQSDKQGTPDDSPGSGRWSPPKTDASQKERADALHEFINRTSNQNKKKSRFDDVKDPPAPERGAAQQAAKMVEEALRADVNDSKALESSLDASRNAMNKRIEEARNAFRQQMTHDDWLRKDSHTKVVFRDVRARDVAGLRPPQLTADDLVTVQKLRALFNRIMGKRRMQLEETGSEVDVLAAIEHRVTGQPMPVFRHEVRGQGFKPLILLDRSGSMGGDKQYQAERACRIIARALRYPFVDLHVWGFQSLADGQVDLVRFDPRLEVFDSSKSKIGGYTPFHLAIRVAHRFLDRGSEMKHLFAVTDGFPVYHRKDGAAFSTRQLIMLVRDEVQLARSRGIATTGTIIGTRAVLYNDTPESVHYDLGERELRFMFGPQRYWKQIDPQNFGRDLVRVVATSFVDYLNRV